MKSTAVDISVSTAEPEIIKSSVNEVKKNSLRTNLLCGAGIKTKDDVKKSIELGAKGVILASGVVKAENVSQAIENLVKGLV